MKHIACVQDLRLLARRRVPKMFYDYVDGGAWSESTYRANADDLQKIRLRQRVAVDVTRRSARTTILGQTCRMPVAVAPTGLTGMIWPNGEILSLRACEEFGIPYCLSTMSISSLEEVAAAASVPFWFQLYVTKDRAFIAQLLNRADEAGVQTLILTLDLQMVGQRNKDVHNGLSSPPRPTPRNLINILTKPAWCAAMLRRRQMAFGNLYGHIAEIKDSKSLAKWTDSQLDASLDWDDVQRIRDRWKGKLILKGLMDPDDALIATKIGAEALIVSNHGGRQLDGAPSTISALPSIVDVVGGKIEIHFDGGIMSGHDVFKALASGANSVMIGRAMLYGLGAGGQAGVTKALNMICHELETTMGQCGVNSVGEIGQHNIYQRSCNA